ncbi:MAG: nuclear transport factor 2 family protein [Microbacteriaceae bacterium]|nr:nuclear transport factor 2 family protein [Microbacteriaceae bacterium]
MDLTTPAAITRRYIQAVSDHDVTPLQQLFSDQLVATIGDSSFTKQEWIVAIEKLLPALLRNEIRNLFVDGSTTCVVYDFVTDTVAGAVTCVEVLTIQDGEIRTIELVFDRLAFAPVGQALKERVAAAS